MRLSFALMILSGCGVPFIEPAHARAGVTQQPSTNAPADCRSICVAVTPQLIRDFSVRPENIDCDQRQWWAANDCEACRDVLRINYGVDLTTCP